MMSKLLFAIFMPVALCCAAGNYNVDSVRWGLVSVGAACFRGEPSHTAELETQAVYGTPLCLVDSCGEWWKAELPDGYSAYVNRKSIVEMTDADMRRWRNSSRIVVTSLYDVPVFSDTVDAKEPVGVLPTGSIVEGEIIKGKRYAKALLPDARCGYVEASAMSPIEVWAAQSPDADRILSVARSLIDVPYLWGGTTSKAIDCSGLTKLCWWDAAVILPRNASQQALCGEELLLDENMEFMPCDLLFFEENGRITHVAIYLGNGRYIHSSGRVHIGSFNPSDPFYIDRKVVKAVRLIGSGNGIVRAAEHKAYFDCLNR